MLDEIDRHGHPDDPVMLVSLPVMIVGAIGALAGFILVLSFAFREMGHLRRQRKARRGSG